MAATSSAWRESSASASVSGVMSVTTLIWPPSGNGAVRTSIAVPFGRRRRRICGRPMSNDNCSA